MPVRVEHLIYEDAFKLHIFQRHGTTLSVLLGQDLVWQDVQENEVVPENAGLKLPRYLERELVEAFIESTGLRTHEPTEVRVLREWLAEEKSRVNGVWNKLLQEGVRWGT